MKSQPVKVLVVDPSAIMRKTLAGMLEDQSEVEVVERAGSTDLAVAKVKRCYPDIILLDVDLPDGKGLEMLAALREVTEVPIIALAGPTDSVTHVTLTALRMGADDFVHLGDSWSSTDTPAVKKKLIDKVVAFGRPHRDQVQEVLVHAGEMPKLNADRFDVLTIGSSTGGPPVLEHILLGLPEEFPLPIVIAQHMPATFTAVMSERLNEMCLIQVRHADQRMPIFPGHAYVTQGGQHSRIVRNRDKTLEVDISKEPEDAIYKPSVDVLFESAAGATGKRTLAVILTGMGNDGQLGAGPLHAKGATILSQDEQTCAVYGMPRAVTESGYATAVLNPDQITEALQMMALRYLRSAG